MIMGFNVKQDRFAYGFKTPLKIANNCHYSLRINEVVGPQFVFQLPFMTALCLLLSVIIQILSHSLTYTDSVPYFYP